MRQVKPKSDHHTFCGRERNRQIVLVGKGRGAYLWVGPTEGNVLGGSVYSFSGTKTLRAFARAILAATEAGR